METTTELLDQVKAKHGLPSDGKLSALLGLTRAQVSRYRNKGDAFGEDVALKVADLLDLDPGYVLACAAFERAKSEGARSAWRHVADVSKRFGAAAALLLLVGVPALTPAPAEAAQAKASGGGMYIMLNHKSVSAEGKFNNPYPSLPATLIWNSVLFVLRR